MSEYININKSDETITLCFYIENAEIMAIGEKMNAINEEAYMNGYNWEAFLNYYLEQNAPDILEEMESDPEAGMYTAYYPLTEQNEIKANKFAEIICSLIENEEEIYKILRECSEEIEWD